MPQPIISDAQGREIQPRKPSMLAGNRESVPYDAASLVSDHMAAWRPYLWSPDSETNPFRDRIVARVRDLVRNDGWASGAVTRILDNVVGATFRPTSKPDYRALAAYSGNSAFDAKWADEFGRATEANYRTWANDPGRYCDLQRKSTVSQIMRLAFRHKLIDGDALAMLHWRPGRVGVGKGRYATAIQVIDPDRLSNPQVQFDNQTMRGGVIVDDDGAAVAYWIRRAHQGDWWSMDKSLKWDKIPRETDWGRPIVVHDFDQDRADQHRGAVGVLGPVVTRLKMLAKYDSTELDSAIINSIFGAYIESPYDAEMVESALGTKTGLGDFQDLRSEFHKERKTELGGARVPILFPGEKINAVSAERPSSNFAAFESAVLRNAAAGIGLSEQQLSQNWAEMNYSSARAALLEVWKTLTVRRINFGSGFGDPIWCAHLEEQFEADELPLPAGAPDFMECRAAYSRCRWMGPGRGFIDPVAEKQGAVLGMDAGLSTLEAEVAESVGEDWEDILDQRQREVDAFKSRGLTVPSWSGMQTVTQDGKAPGGGKKPDASEVSQPPERPQPA